MLPYPLRESTRAILLMETFTYQSGTSRIQLPPEQTNMRVRKQSAINTPSGLIRDAKRHDNIRRKRGAHAGCEIAGIAALKTVIRRNES